MKRITVFPDSQRLVVSIGKYYAEQYEYDIQLYNSNEYFNVYKIIGDTSMLGNVELVCCFLNGYDGFDRNDIFGELNDKFDENLESVRDASLNKYTHLFPPIELLTIDEYSRNPYRFKNFRLYFDNFWNIFVDSNLTGKGYIFRQCNDYFDALNIISNICGSEYKEITKYYVLNDGCHCDYYNDVNDAVKKYLDYFNQGRWCYLGASIKSIDVRYYANQQYDMNIIYPSSDFQSHIYCKKVEDSAALRANPELVSGINYIIDTVNPGYMLDVSVYNSKPTSFSRSFIMADKKEKGKVI